VFQVLRQYFLSQRLHQLVFDFQNWLGRQMSVDEQTTGSMYETQVSAAVSEPLVLKRNVVFVEFAHVKTHGLQQLVEVLDRRRPELLPASAVHRRKQTSHKMLSSFMVGESANRPENNVRCTIIATSLSKSDNFKGACGE
jgi:hypothetical protein